ncbi:hypothetical protein MMC16_004277 [Acarospora aff. strigata]|nr:hypothetical protein [Acarospora aff. strigata]
MLIREHKSRNPEADNELWCPVMKQYVDEDSLGAAHNFPYRLGKEVMRSVFGESSANEMFLPRNGLMLYSPSRKKFDKFLLVIIPAGPPESARWKTRVVDSSILTQQLPCSQTTWGTLDNQELEFKGNARPAVRYLYWYYAIAVMKAVKRRSTEEWLNEMQKNCWAMPGRYIRQNMLIALAERIGHCVPEDLEELHDHAIPETPVPKLEDKMAAKVVVDAAEEDNVDW